MLKAKLRRDTLRPLSGIDIISKSERSRNMHWMFGLGLSLFVLIGFVVPVASAQEPNGNERARQGIQLAPGSCVDVNRPLGRGARFDGQLCRDSATGAGAGDATGTYSILGVATGDVTGDGANDVVSVDSHITLERVIDGTSNTMMGRSMTLHLTLQGSVGTFTMPSGITIQGGSGADVLRQFVDRTLGIIGVLVGG
jgi:hypothetical protein